jgi:hypothetical protein
MPTPNAKAQRRANQKAHHEDTKNTKDHKEKRDKRIREFDITAEFDAVEAELPEILCPNTGGLPVDDSSTDFSMKDFLRVPSCSSCLRGGIHGFVLVLRFSNV